MRRLLTILLAAMAFVACTQNEVEELTANREALPETLTVGFEGGDTRIELNEVLKTVWTEGDEVSVYFYSDANQKWQYQGETGERLGTLRRVDAGVATTQTDYVVVAYPYNTSYTLNRINANLIASLPAVQSYKEGSYGAEGNIMVAQSEFTQFSLKSVCGWLRVELTGEGEVVESVKVRGNNGEQVAGLIYVDTATAEAILASEMGEASDEEQVGGVGGDLEFDDTVFTEVTLDCGDGVELGAEAKEFYVALLPQTFEKGMTVEINYANGSSQTLVCDSSITIRRNHISPIESEANVEVEVPSNQLWYTATALVEPYKSSAFNVAIVSNEWDEATGEGVITFDGELTTIGVRAFENCDSLTSVTIGDSVTTIGVGVFADCDSLTSVTIGDSVTTIRDYAFNGCDSLAEFKGKFAADGGRCLIKDNTLIAYANASGTTYTIPDSVTTIGNRVFAGCSNLTSVTIPDSVTTIEGGVFGGCSNLAEFKGKFAADEGRCLIVDGVLNAFAIGCGVTEYTIPDSVMTIGVSAFHYCSSLTSVTIPDSVTTIGVSAFSYCDNLTSVTIGDSVTTIGGYAFCCCGLTSVTIPDSVTTIGNYAFYDCYSLTSVYCKATTPPTLGGSTVFDSNKSDRKIYVPAESVEAYKAAEYWSEYAADIVGYDFDAGEEEINAYIKITSESVASFTAEGGSGSISYTIENATEETELIAVVSPAENEWITISEVTATTVNYTVAANEEYKIREAHVVLMYGEQSATVRITQDPKEREEEIKNVEFSSATLGQTTPGGILVKFADATNAYELNLTFYADEKAALPAGVYKPGYQFDGSLGYNAESYMLVGGVEHKYNAEKNATNATVEVTANGEAYTFKFNDILFGDEYMATGTCSVELSFAEEEEPFNATHTATKWLWSGPSNYGNKYVVSGDGFTIDVHFPTSVATESSLATGEYVWKGTSFFMNNDATNFTTRSFKLDGSSNTVPISDGSAKVTASGDTYTIQLTLVHRDSGYEYMIEYVGKLNDTGEQGGGEVNPDGPIKLTRFAYEMDMCGNGLGYFWRASGENVSLGVAITSRSCTQDSINAGDYVYNMYPDDVEYAFQLRASEYNGVSVGDSNSTMKVEKSGEEYKITIVASGHTFVYEGTLN